MSARALLGAACVLAAAASCAEGQVDDAITLRDAQPDEVEPADVATKPDAPDASTTDAPASDVPIATRDAPALDVSSDAPAVDVATTDVARDLSGVVETPPPVDAGRAGDSLPAGAVMFFTATACPTGWSAFTDAAGRVLSASAGDSGAGAVRGAALGDGEDRAHTHDVTARFTLSSVSYVGIVGPANNGVAAAGEVTMHGATEAASSGLPYVQLLVCRKSEPAEPGSIPLPRGMSVFFSGSRCPTGFTQSAESQGRVLVGLPSGGTPGATFGGAPLSPGAATTHGHDVSLSLATTSHGIALASGCCGGGFARNETVTATVPTDRAEPAVPTVLLLHCQKD